MACGQLAVSLASLGSVFDYILRFDTLLLCSLWFTHFEVMLMLCCSGAALKLATLNLYLGCLK